MSTVLEDVLGVAVEGFLLAAFAGTLYRLMSGRFLIPKRTSILPYECGVVVKGSQTIKTVGPGTCWIRPKQRIVLCDMRPRPLQLLGIETLAADGGIVRLSLSGEYAITNPESFIRVSREAGNTFVAAVRRAISDAVREHSSLVLVANPELLVVRLRELIKPTSKKVGMDFLTLEAWEVLHTGWLRQQPEEKTIQLLH